MSCIAVHCASGSAEPSAAAVAAALASAFNSGVALELARFGGIFAMLSKPSKALHDMYCRIMVVVALAFARVVRKVKVHFNVLAAAICIGPICRRSGFMSFCLFTYTLVILQLPSETPPGKRSYMAATSAQVALGESGWDPCCGNNITKALRRN